MSDALKKCFFSENEIKVTNSSTSENRYIEADGYRYYIGDREFLNLRNNNELSDENKNLCLQETVRLNRNDIVPLWLWKHGNHSLPGKIDENLVQPVFLEDFAIRKIKLNYKSKAANILNLLSNKMLNSENPFQKTHFEKSDLYYLGIFDKNEFIQWIQHLLTSKLIEVDVETRESLFESKKPTGFLLTRLLSQNIISLSIKGWDLIHEQKNYTNYKNVFIAMAFSDLDGKICQNDTRNAIKDTLKKLNFNPQIVDEVEHNDGIMDKVIALINESRFIISEFTHHKNGVYYEAGYARGRGIPVIHIVKKDMLDKAHFDIKHLNLIVWENDSDLKEKLENRIRATVNKHDFN